MRRAGSRERKGGEKKRELRKKEEEKKENAALFIHNMIRSCNYHSPRYWGRKKRGYLWRGEEEK